MIFAGWAEGQLLFLLISVEKGEVFGNYPRNLCQLAWNLRDFPDVCCGDHLIWCVCVGGDVGVDGGVLVNIFNPTVDDRLAQKTSLDGNHLNQLPGDLMEQPSPLASAWSTPWMMQKQLKS